MPRGGKDHHAGISHAREASGVLHHRIQRPIDDPRYIVIDLDFDTDAEAKAFLQILQTRVWASIESSPALVGTPQTKILAPPEVDGT